MSKVTGKKRIVAVVNKSWECDPVMFVLTNDNVRPSPSLGWPTLYHYPCPRHDHSTGPRAVFDGMKNIAAEIWCISDLLAVYEDDGCHQSSSELKMKVLPAIFEEHADMVIAVGTAAYYPPFASNNGSVVAGTRVFMHNGHPGGENRCSNWQDGPFDTVVNSSLPRGTFDRYMDFSRNLRPISDYFLPAVTGPAESPGIYSRYDFVACNTVNVTDYTEYDAKDLETMSAYARACPDASGRSLETTHGLIKVASGATPFMFLSGIVDRFGCFDIDVSRRQYPQNLAGAHNAGVVLAHLLANIDQAYGAGKEQVVM